MHLDEVVHQFIHPDDERARRQLEGIPGFAAAVKTFPKIAYERVLYGLNMADKIRRGPEQLPELYGRLRPIRARLGIAEPEFYLEMNPEPNAYTFGDTRVTLTNTSGLVEHLDGGELGGVLAHECGRIACRHVLYHTMASLLLQGAALSGIAALRTQPMQLALLCWQRRSELSADCAAAPALGLPTPLVETMIRRAGGSKAITGGVNIRAGAAQADASTICLKAPGKPAEKSCYPSENTIPRPPKPPTRRETPFAANAARSCRKKSNFASPAAKKQYRIEV